MTIIFEENIRTNSIKDIAAKMMLAARTAPKARGIDNLVIAIAEKEDIAKIAATMRVIAAYQVSPWDNYFLRDATNILATEIMLLIGTKIKPMGITDCGLCGFASCQEKLTNPNHPCAFNTNDLGIACGAALNIAMDHRVDNRIMYTVGKAVRKLGFERSLIN